MERRHFLTASTASIFAFAGCAGSAEQTPSSKETSTAHPNYTTDNWRIDFSQWYAVESLPYYDSETESVEELEPQNDWWLEASITMTYLPNGSAEAPPADRFSLNRIDTQSERDPRLSIPDVAWDDIRLEDPHATYWFEPGWLAGRTTQGGQKSTLYLLFDVLERENHPRIVYSHNSEEVNLRPKFGLLPSGEVLRS